MDARKNERKKGQKQAEGTKQQEGLEGGVERGWRERSGVWLERRKNKVERKLGGGWKSGGRTEGMRGARAGGEETEEMKERGH